MATTRSSSIAIAFAGSMAHARDSKHPGQDSFAAVAARSAPVPTSKISHPLPTPPNSISPSLPPHGLKARAAAAGTLSHLDTVESDLDLQDAVVGSFNSQHGLETAGAITSGLLAKYHLPEILLNNGPLAIRHVMGYLTTSVPGFSGIPPAKARRLVVGALEGRGSGGEGGGINGDVEFEKVGWGRWDARIKGQPARDSRGAHDSPPPSSPSSYSAGIPIAHVSEGRPRPNNPTSWAGDSAFSPDEDMDMHMLETEADKMSLDGSCSSSEAPPEDEIMDDDPNDLTDDEDWAALGAAALRQASYSASGPGRNPFSSHVYTGDSRGSGGPPTSALAKSVPFPSNNFQHKFDFSAFGMTSDSQEREAIEALLRLGSV